MTLQSMWQRCVASLAPLTLITGCATGPASLTPAQQTQIATAQAQTAIAEYGTQTAQLTGLQLQGLATIFAMREGNLSPQEMQLLAAQLYKTISQSTSDQGEQINQYIDLEIKNAVAQGQENRAKQIAISRVFSAYGMKQSGQGENASPFLSCQFGAQNGLKMTLTLPPSEINLNQIELGETTYSGLCEIKRNSILASDNYQKQEPIYIRHGIDLRTMSLLAPATAIGAAP